MIVRKPGAARRRAMNVLALIATCTMPVAPLQAQAPDSSASDRWMLNVSLGKCTLMRTFTQPQPAQLAISTDAGTDDYAVAFLRAGPRVNSDEIDRGAIQIDGKAQTLDFVRVSRVTGSLPSSISLHTGRSTVDAIGGGADFAIKSPIGSVGPVPLPGAAKAIAALHRCEADQLIEWGADPAQFAPGGVPPRVGDRGYWVSQSVMDKIHVPKTPIKPLHYLVLSDLGVVERCTAVFGVPDSDYTDVVCKTMMGRKLGAPARDASGRAVRSVVAFIPERMVIIAR